MTPAQALKPLALVCWAALALSCTADVSTLPDGGADAGPDAGDLPGPDGGDDAGSDAGSDAGQAPDAGADAGVPDAGTTPDPLGQLSKALRVNNFGWRPADRKVAVLLGHAAAAAQLRRVPDNAIAGSYTASALFADEDSGDQVATVDFTALATPGDYYLYLPGPGLRSYPFRIAADVFDIVGEAAVKSYYYQRCNHGRALPYARDTLGGFPGRGGQWVDAACHMSDSALPAGPGSADHGNLDLRGGWHDAGDYQKTLWGRGVTELLFAYEVNPTAWRDGQLNLPESANGIPDLLDEVRWELDFYVRMQRPDGHFMSSAKGHNATNTSPPSQSDEARVYFDCTSPSGGGWSGGGVTLASATGNAVLSLAHAAIVFRAAGQTALGDGYAAAATQGWSWLDGQTLSGAERRLKAAAASAVYRMNPALASAGTFADAFPWDTFDGQLPYSATPAEGVVSAGAFHYLANASGASAVKSKARTGVAALVERAFSEAGAYGGLFGGPGNAWDWSWGSNRQQSSYGANLLMAAHFGALGTRSAAEVAFQAQKHFHFMLGLNPLNMVYLSNMAAYGGEHSSFQLYHCWFSYTGNDGDNGNASYNGKPPGVYEPLYPYYPDDAQTSTFGPAPGLVPGGPNTGYAGTYVIPNKGFPAYAYRDFSVGCDWSGSICRAASWEITEPMAAYQGPFVLLASFMMSGS